ncbi:MAG: hypothetical protein WAU82_15930 [Candidatus Binatus sp.]|uniref:hypothetical protein n=1 Tax=Candidatus Binatus sp. TaxID=2811406 RepID=UPI003BD23FEF
MFAGHETTGEQVCNRISKPLATCCRESVGIWIDDRGNDESENKSKKYVPNARSWRLEEILPIGSRDRHCCAAVFRLLEYPKLSIARAVSQHQFPETKLIFPETKLITAGVTGGGDRACGIRNHYS